MQVLVPPFWLPPPIILFTAVMPTVRLPELQPVAGVFLRSSFLKPGSLNSVLSFWQQKKVIADLRLILSREQVCVYITFPGPHLAAFIGWFVPSQIGPPVAQPWLRYHRLGFDSGSQAESLGHIFVQAKPLFVTFEQKWCSTFSSPLWHFSLQKKDIYSNTNCVILA